MDMLYVHGKSPSWVTLCIFRHAMQDFFREIEQLDDIGEVLWYAVKVCKDQGVVRQSYHFTPLFDAPTSERTVVHAVGFDPEWLECYDESEFRKKDPIPARTMSHGALLSWKDAESMAPNTEANEEYFAAMREFGLIHGFGLPLFGPRGRNAYASFDFGKPLSEVSSEQLGIVRTVPQAAHQRVCVLLDAERDMPELSEREAELPIFSISRQILSKPTPRGFTRSWEPRTASGRW